MFFILLEYPLFDTPRNTERNRGILMAEYTLPLRKWYTLEKACIRLEELTGKKVDIDDLLHYWSEGMLIFRMNLDLMAYNNSVLYGRLGKKAFFDSSVLIFNIFFKSGDPISYYLSYSNGICNIQSEEESFFYDDGFIDISIFKDSDLIKEIIHIGNNEHIKTLNNKDEIDCSFFIKGYIPIWGVEIDELVNSEHRTLFSSIKSSYKTECESKISRIEITIGVGIREGKIEQNELVIFEDDLIDFLNGKYNTLAIKNDFYMYKGRYEEIKIETKTASNNKSDVIAKLLKLGWGINDRKDARNALENPNHPLKIAIDKNGLDFPSGKTISNWYNI